MPMMRYIVSSKCPIIRTYSLEELKKATKDFKILLGSGSTSNVYLDEFGDGKFAAIKRVVEKRGDTMKFFFDEVSVLLRISHPNLVFRTRLVSIAFGINSTISQINNVFILAGQSNMAGRGGVLNGSTWDGHVPPQCQSNPSIFRLNAALTWVGAEEPLHKDIDRNRTCGVGPGMAFANAVVSRDQNIGVVGLVPCAVGGTNLSEWRRGSRLYNHLVRRSMAALGSGGRIRALLWYQGESDTLNHEDAIQYKKRLYRFINHVRSDLQVPSLPMIMVALASGEGPFMEVVREAQLGIDLPNVKVVDAKGMALEADRLHLTTAAQVQLGHMLADAFLQKELPLPAQSSASKLSFCFVLGLSLSLVNWMLTL